MSVTDDDLRNLSPEQQEQIQQGRLFLHHFFAILRGALYHSTNNVALEEPSIAFSKQLRWALDHEGLTNMSFVVGNGQVFLGSLRVRPHERQVKVVKDLQSFLDQRGLGGLRFSKDLSPEQSRTLAQVLVHFVKPPEGQDAVAAFSHDLEEARLANRLRAMPPMRAKTMEGTGQLAFKTELGSLVQKFAKGYGVLKTNKEDLSRSPTARGVMKHVVREIAEAHGEALDSMIGLAMLAASLDHAMRSLAVILVSMAVADQFGATRELLSEVGQAGAEIAHWDKEVVERSRTYGKPMAGAAALAGITNLRQWPLATIRRYLSVGGRYLPPEGGPNPEGTPTSTRVAEIIRIASDYIDLTTPTPMAKTEHLFADSPIAPHEALLELRDQVGARFSKDVYAALTRGVGYLPVGTAVLTADGAGCVITKRTSDPMSYFAKDSKTLRDREAAFLKGPNQIVSVFVGAELLEVRSKCLLGDDHDTLLSAAATAREAAG